MNLLGLLFCLCAVVVPLSDFLLSNSIALYSNSFNIVQCIAMDLILHYIGSIHSFYESVPKY
jgi:hypothetical protein